MHEGLGSVLVMRVYSYSMEQGSRGTTRAAARGFRRSLLLVDGLGEPEPWKRESWAGMDMDLDLDMDMDSVDLVLVLVLVLVAVQQSPSARSLRVEVATQEGDRQFKVGGTVQIAATQH